MGGRMLAVNAWEKREDWRPMAPRYPPHPPDCRRPHCTGTCVDGAIPADPARPVAGQLPHLGGAGQARVPARRAPAPVGAVAVRSRERICWPAKAPSPPAWDRRFRLSTHRSRCLARRHHGKDIIESHRPQIGSEGVGDAGGIVDRRFRATPLRYSLLSQAVTASVWAPSPYPGSLSPSTV